MAHAGSSRRPSMVGGCGVRVAVMCGRGGGSVARDGRPRLGEQRGEDGGGGRHGPRTLYNPGDADRGSPGRTARRVGVVRHPQSRRRRAAAGAAAGGASCARWARRRSTRSTVGDHAYVYARFGGDSPRVLLNAHVDTVPANEGYTSPPHLLVRRGDRLLRPRHRRHQGRDRRDPGGARGRADHAAGRRAVLGRRGARRQLHPRVPRQRRGARAGARDRLRADAAAAWACATAASAPRPSRWRPRADIRRASTRWSTRSRCWRGPRSRWTTWGSNIDRRGRPASRAST